jgi:hypothetical protein
MNTITPREFNKNDLLIIQNVLYKITGISTCKPYGVKLPKKIGIVAFNSELDKKIELVYPENFKFIKEDDGTINLDKAHLFVNYDDYIKPN